MRRPVVTENTAIVDVVVDPYLARHLKPHQREGVSFMYECIMGMRSENTGIQTNILSDNKSWFVKEKKEISMSLGDTPQGFPFGAKMGKVPPCLPPYFSEKFSTKLKKAFLRHETQC